MDLNVTIVDLATRAGFGPGQMAPTISNCHIDYPWGGQTGNVTPYVYHNTMPVECSGDVHVFPCPHCGKCKCGKATVTRGKKC